MRLARRKWRVALIAATATAAAVTATLIATAPADAAAVPSGCTASGPYEVCFTSPATTASRTIIYRKLRSMVGSAGKGDHIRIALYGWTLHKLAERVISAHQRGVDVQIVLDSKNADDWAYNHMSRAHVPIHLCPKGRGCIGTHIMHDKFFLFDIGGRKTVVQTSFNATKNQLGKYNNLIRVAGDTKLYNYYLSYWNLLNHNDRNGFAKFPNHKAGSLATKAYVFPRATGDPVLGILNNVTKCVKGHRKIYLAESIFTSKRADVRNRLAYMQTKMHCNVAVVVQKKADEDWVQSPAPQGNLKNSKVRRAYLHHKYIIIDAKYNGAWQQVVFTGSHNMNRRSLRDDDEAMLRIHNSYVYNAYHKEFVALFEAAKGG